MDHTCGAADSACDDGLIGVLLTFYAQIGIKSGGAKPEVGILFRGRIAGRGYPLDIPKQLAIKLRYMSFMGKMSVLAMRSLIVFSSRS